MIGFIVAIIAALRALRRATRPREWSLGLTHDAPASLSASKTALASTLLPPDGVTMDFRTALVCNRSERLGLALAHELGHVLLGTSPSLHNNINGNFMNTNVTESKGEVSESQQIRMRAMYTKCAGGAPGWKWEKKLPTAAPTPTPSATRR